MLMSLSNEHTPEPVHDSQTGRGDRMIGLYPDKASRYRDTEDNEQPDHQHTTVQYTLQNRGCDR